LSDLQLQGHLSIAGLSFCLLQAFLDVCLYSYAVADEMLTDIVHCAVPLIMR